MWRRNEGQAYCVGCRVSESQHSSHLGPILSHTHTLSHPFMCERKRERQRQTETEIESEKERQSQRETHTQRKRETERKRKRKKEREREMHLAASMVYVYHIPVVPPSFSEFQQAKMSSHFQVSFEWHTSSAAGSREARHITVLEVRSGLGGGVDVTTPLGQSFGSTGHQDLHM